MPISVLAAFWAVSFLFVITPGVDWAYAISAGMQGRRVLAAVGGMLCGHLIAILVVAAGVGGVVAGNPLALAALTIVGSLYLLWLGVNMVRNPAMPQADPTKAPAPWSRWAIKGICVSGLNPKVFLLFLALLPQFTTPLAALSVPVQIISLGLVHMASCAVIYLLVGFGAQVVLRSRPSAARWVSRVSGAAMMFIAVGLLAERMCG
jgi:threonine/homoserine/homoserine lactone efflux protein